VIQTRLLVKILLLGLIVVIVQIAGLAQISILGGHFDLTPLIVVSVALLAGSVAGAIAGFSMGLLLDLALMQTLGVSSLIYVGVGYLAGRIGELSDSRTPAVPLVAGAIATVGSILGFALMQFLLGVTVSFGGLVLREIVITLILNTAIALPIYLLVRWILGPNLESERRPTVRRSSAYSDQVLSQLSKK
jgi:rod shape-determining protein MreD